MKMKGVTIMELWVLVLVILVLCYFFFPAGIFVEEDRAISCLKTQGYSEIDILEKAVWIISWRGGDSKDSVRFTCRAKNPSGEEVKIYVFSGWFFKYSTIRTN